MRIFYNTVIVPSLSVDGYQQQGATTIAVNTQTGSSKTFFFVNNLDFLGKIFGLLVLTGAYRVENDFPSGFTGHVQNIKALSITQLVFTSSKYQSQQ